MSTHTMSRAVAVSVIAFMALAGTVPAGAETPQANPVVRLTPYGPLTTSLPDAAETVRPNSGTPPATFDLRNVSGINYVTPVRDQGNCGSCWAFAAFGSVESNALIQGAGSLNLSENNLKNRHGFDWGPCDGGHTWISTAYMARLSGPGSEIDDPYHAWDDRATAPVTVTRQRTLRDALVLDTASEMKNAIMTFGALDVSMFWSNSAYRSSDYTYCYTGSEINHEVACVGWDDTKPTAGGTGAWLIKNSWGAAWGNNGYFWLSYQDSVGGKSGVSYQTAAANVVNKCYTHAPFGEVGSVNTPYSCTRFTTSSQTGQQLKSVGFFTEADNAAYTIRIYDSWSGGAPSGLLATLSGTETWQGFHMVDLPAAVSLGANDEYVVYLYTNGGAYPQAFEYREVGYDSAATAALGQSYYSFDGTSWEDLAAWDSTANFTIYAYTVPEPMTMALLALGALTMLRRGRKS